MDRLKDQALLLRFLGNGVMATTFHFGLLYFFLKVVGMSSAGTSNLLAAVGGVTASFLGNRYYVFRAGSRPVLAQASKFILLYSGTTLMHGLVLFGWTDLAGQDYRAGFLIASALQMAISFLGNRLMVFKV